MIARREAAWAILALAGFVFAGCRSSAPDTGTPSTMGHGAGSQTHFQAEVYEVQASVERLDALDGKALAKQASNPDRLLKALSAFGKARILYRFDQPVNVAGDSLSIRTSEPVVMATRTAPNGERINSVKYDDVGVILRLSADDATDVARKRTEVTLKGELAVLAVGNVELVAGQKAVSVRTLAFEHKDELEPGKPRVMVTVNSTSTEPTQPAAVYVVRYVFGR